MRNLKERYALQYMAQVEFIRFRDMFLDAETDIRRLKLTIEHLERRQADALQEIEYLFEHNEKNKENPAIGQPTQG